MLFLMVLLSVWTELTPSLPPCSVLKPTHAPVWSVVCGLSEGCQCLLSEQLTVFLKLCYHNEAINELLGGRAAQEASPGGTIIIAGIFRGCKFSRKDL